MKSIFNSFGLFVLALILITSCKKEKKAKEVKENPQKTEVVVKKTKQQLEEIVIQLNNIKSRENVSIYDRKFNTDKTAIYTTFSDSLEVIKKTFLNKTPVNENITYQIPKNKVINFYIDASLEEYNYFLKAGDSLTINFNDKGLVEKSILNGKDDDIALIFSKNSIPVKSIEYLKYFMKHYGRIKDHIFEKRFEKDFRKKFTKTTKKIKENSEKTAPLIYKALEKHLKYTNIKNNYSKGIEENISFDDFSMSLKSYRDFGKNMLLKISNIDYFDNEKLAIKESMKTVDFLMNDTSFKNHPKSRNMLLRELIKITGHYEPNLIPELMSEISDTKLRDEYTKMYSSQYLLELKEFQNDTENINLVSIEDPKKVFSFQDFLNQNKGKVIYVDLWASWCGPCRKQLIPSNKLRKELSKFPIVFSFFSTDKSFAQWKTAQIEEEMDTEPNSFLLLNTKKSTRYKSWNVRGIPRYLIFDKAGKLVVKNAPIPSDPKAKEMLLKYI